MIPDKLASDCSCGCGYLYIRAVLRQGKDLVIVQEAFSMHVFGFTTHPRSCRLVVLNAHTSPTMAPRSCPTTSQTSYSSTLPVEILSPTAYLRTLYERRDALRRCALDMDVDSDTGKRDTTDALRERVREALQADDPWRQLRHVLKLRSTLCGRRYVRFLSV